MIPKYNFELNFLLSKLSVAWYTHIIIFFLKKNPSYPVTTKKKLSQS